MKTLLFRSLLTLIIFSCMDSPDQKYSPIVSLQIHDLIKDSLLNIRALEIEDNRIRAVSAIGDSYSVDLRTNKVYVNRVNIDTINFRASAIVNNYYFTLSIGDPAYLFKDTELVYKETHPNIFYDALHFWNSMEGVAIGDPVDGCMSILITRNGGTSWNKVSCEVLPSSIEGEAAFAASDTNIAIVGNHTWVATGGLSSRILVSHDKGVSWSVVNIPIIQGKETTGVFSIDFYDSLNGFAIGGDYTDPNAKHSNKIRTIDGGISWEVVAQDQSPGYRSCVQYIPNSNAKGLVAVGFGGINVSNNAGESWKLLSDDSFYTLRFLNDSIAYAAGKGKLSKIIFK